MSMAVFQHLKDLHAYYTAQEQRRWGEVEDFYLMDPEEFRRIFDEAPGAHQERPAEAQISPAYDPMLMAECRYCGKPKRARWLISHQNYECLQNPNRRNENMTSRGDIPRHWPEENLPREHPMQRSQARGGMSTVTGRICDQCGKMIPHANWNAHRAFHGTIRAPSTSLQCDICYATFQTQEGVEDCRQEHIDRGEVRRDRHEASGASEIHSEPKIRI